MLHEETTSDWRDKERGVVGDGEERSKTKWSSPEQGQNSCGFEDQNQKNKQTRVENENDYVWSFEILNELKQVESSDTMYRVSISIQKVTILSMYLW